MKKMIIGLFTAILMSAGLVSFAGASAQAVDYPGTVATTTKATAPNSVKAGGKAVVSVKVAAGNAKPVGKVTVTIKGKGFTFKKTVSYSGGKVSVPSSKLTKKGSYKVTVKFAAADGSVFKDSKATDTIKVK
jgi:hypothetical protein